MAELRFELATPGSAVRRATDCAMIPSTRPFWKEVYPKRKEFAPKFVLFRVDPFSVETENNFENSVSLESVPVSLTPNPRGQTMLKKTSIQRLDVESTLHRCCFNWIFNSFEERHFTVCWCLETCCIQSSSSFITATRSCLGSNLQ